MKKWIALPDSVAVSRDSRWIAVSSHDTHAIFVYRYDRPLDPNFDPAGVLRSHYPHGLRFTSDNRFVFAASAGSPYVNIYETENADWRGVRAPVLSVRVLSNDDFFRGRHNLQEGGPKGIDINHSKGLLVTTCETQPLGFFDLATIQDACEKNLVYCRGRKLRFTPNSMAIRYELYRCPSYNSCGGRYSLDTLEGSAFKLGFKQSTKSLECGPHAQTVLMAKIHFETGGGVERPILWQRKIFLLSGHLHRAKAMNAKEAHELP